MSNPTGNGGGMSKIVRSSVRTGKPNQGVNPGHASQLGTAVDPKVAARTPMYTKALQTPKLGNEVALNVGKGGCGTGRTIMRSGAQGQHGPTNPGNRPTPTNNDAQFTHFGFPAHTEAQKKSNV